MIKKTVYLLTVMLVVFGMFASATPASAHTEWARVMGKIAAVDTTANTVTITPRSDAPDVVLTVDASTKIRRNLRLVALADLQVGDRVDARYDKTTLLATRIFAHYKVTESHGKITAVDTDARTVTIAPQKGGDDVVLKVDDSTTIKFHGKPATLADLQAGYRVSVWYDPATNIASKLFAIFLPAQVNGFITAVDTAASTVSVTRFSNGKNVTLCVDAKTIIRRNNHTITLADLKVGDKVSIKYNATTQVALRIIANSQPGKARLHGTIASVDTGASTVTITPDKDGADVVLTVNAETLLWRNGKTAALADLQAGDQALAWYDPATMIASKIFAVRVPAFMLGKISALDTVAGTVTITPTDGNPALTLTVDTATKITLNGSDATLADLLVDDNVMAWYYVSTLAATQISVIR